MRQGCQEVEISISADADRGCLPEAQHQRSNCPVKRHKLSKAWGSMPMASMDELRDDIKAHGLRDPVVVHEGEILDGWHRYSACVAAGIEPDEVDFDPDLDGDPIDFVISKNAYRRHLKAKDRARIVLRLKPPTKVGPGRPKAGERTVKDVAKDAGTSINTVKRVLEEDKPKPKKVKETVEPVKKASEKVKDQAEKPTYEILESTVKEVMEELSIEEDRTLKEHQHACELEEKVRLLEAALAGDSADWALERISTLEDELRAANNRSAHWERKYRSAIYRVEQLEKANATITSASVEAGD